LLVDIVQIGPSATVSMHSWLALFPSHTLLLGINLYGEPWDKLKGMVDSAE